MIRVCVFTDMRVDGGIELKAMGFARGVRQFCFLSNK